MKNNLSMEIEKDDLLSAFEHSNRNRNIKLFDYYQVWFVNKDFLSHDIIRKIKADLGVDISRCTVHYIRSKIMPKRLEELKNISINSSSTKSILEAKIDSNSLSDSTFNFEFKEPKNIDHHQDIVTFRKPKHETN